MSEVNTTQVIGATKKSLVPALLIFVGLLILGLFVAAALLQIQTSEAFIMGRAAPTTFQPNWTIITQIPSMFSGTMSTLEVKAIMWGWGVELFFLVCFVGYEITHETIRFHNRTMAKWFQIGLLAIFVLDVWTDYNYSPSGDPWGQFLFSVMTAFVVAYGALVAFSLIGHGFRDLMK